MRSTGDAASRPRGAVDACDALPLLWAAQTCEEALLRDGVMGVGDR